MTASADDIAGDLALAIHQRLIRPGERLPSQSKLMSSYGVAMATAASALAKLAAAGLTRSEPGRGTFARARPPMTPCPVLDVLAAASVCRSLAASGFARKPTFSIGGHPDWDTPYCDPEKHWPPRTVDASALDGLDRYVLRWMSEALYAAARHMVGHGTAAADPHLIAAAQAILENGAKRPEAQAAIGVSGPPVPDCEAVALRIWPERARVPGPDEPPF